MFKPYGVLSRFQDPEGRPTLTEFVRAAGVYPVGRLDFDSEGLLLLTDDGALAARLTNPRFGCPKVYLAQVEREPTDEALSQLRRGLNLADGPTRPAEVERLATPPDLPPRPVAIRTRLRVPTAWLRLILREGRNRQVRRMTAAVGHPTLRLVRAAVGPIGLDGLNPGDCRPLSRPEVAALRTMTPDARAAASR